MLKRHDDMPEDEDGELSGTCPSNSMLNVCDHAWPDTCRRDHGPGQGSTAMPSVSSVAGSALLGSS